MEKVAKCIICQQKLVGKELKQVGGKYYCNAHYSEQFDKKFDEEKANKVKRMLNRNV